MRTAVISSSEVVLEQALVPSPRWLDEDEARAWRSLQMMQARLSAALARDLLAHSHLSYQDYVVLIALTEASEGRLRLFELGHAIGWEKSRTSHHVGRMAERGLVQKFSCGSDRRGQWVSVTRLGRAAIEAAAPSHVAAVRRLFVDRLSREQLAHVASFAQTVLSALDELPDDICDEVRQEEEVMEEEVR